MTPLLQWLNPGILGHLPTFTARPSEGNGDVSSSAAGGRQCPQCLPFQRVPTWTHHARYSPHPPSNRFPQALVQLRCF